MTRNKLEKGISLNFFHGNEYFLNVPQFLNFLFFQISETLGSKLKRIFGFLDA